VVLFGGSVGVVVGWLRCLGRVGGDGVQEGAVAGGLGAGRDQLVEGVAHAVQVGDSGGEVGDAVFGECSCGVGGVEAASGQVEEFVDLVEGESQLLGAFDESEHLGGS
jgi:hypothetical protein